VSTRQQVIAAMVSFVTIRSKAANLRGALDTLKEDVAEWMDAHQDEQELVDTSTEIRAFWQDVSGGQVLNVAALDDHTLRWAADQGLLEGNMRAIAACKYTAPELVGIHQNTSTAPGYRKLQVVPPSYQRRQELEEQAKNGQAPQPATPPTPIREQSGSAVPNPPPSAAPAQLCPTHGRSRRSEKSGGLYCPTNTPDGWCTWSTIRQSA
jgi:hypothetical protein